MNFVRALVSRPLPPFLHDRQPPKPKTENMMEKTGGEGGEERPTAATPGRLQFPEKEKRNRFGEEEEDEGNFGFLFTSIYLQYRPADPCLVHELY